MLSVGAQQVRNALGIDARLRLLQRPLYFAGGFLQGGLKGVQQSLWLGFLCISALTIIFLLAGSPLRFA